MADESLRTAISSAATLRGAIVTSYAQVEHLLADIVVRCLPMAEYNTLPPRLPYTLKSRIARVGQLVGMPGPLAKYKADFERISAELQQFEELRHFMAHGLLTVRTGDDGNHQLIYRMYRETKGHAIEEGRLETNLDQLQSAAEQIGRYSIRAVTLFRDVYSAHNLVPR